MRTYLILVILLVFHIGSQSQPTYPNGVPGCIARWNFCSNGTINSLPDVSGNGNNGTVFNLTTTTGFRNAVNTAMSFDGSTSYALVNHSLSLAPQDITMIALVKFNGWYSGSCQGSQIVSKGFPYFIQGYYGLSTSDHAFDNDCNIFSPNNMLVEIQLANLTGNFPSLNYIQTNQWYFMAATYGANNLKVYLVPMNTANHVNNISPIHNVNLAPGGFGTNTQNLSIGRHLNPTHPYWFNGAMDEVAMFNRALSQSEIQSVYDYLWQVVTIVQTPTNFCAGSSFNVNYTVNTLNYFLAGNIFTVQLSDASGSFATPTTIGTLISSTSGTIPCNIPVGTPSGNGYRIRIVSTNTAYIAEKENCGNTITISGSVVTPPTASSNSPVCEGGTLTLTASTIPGATYSWTGPGGFNSNAQNPTISNIQPVAAGTYNVTATVGSCTSAPTPVLVAVNPTPQPPSAGSNSPLCIGSTLQLTANGAPGATYNWNGPGGFSSSQQNPTIPNIATAGAGTYTVTSTVNGCSSTAASVTVSLSNSAAPSLGIYPSPNDSVCVDVPVTFVAIANNVGTSPQYQWMKNGQIITGATGATYQTSNIITGDYFSCEVINGSNCPVPPVLSSNNIVMTVLPQSSALVSITANPGLVLSPWETVTFTASPVNGGTTPVYQWYRNGQPVIGAISHTWSANNLWNSDTISVTMQSSDLCATPKPAASNILVVQIKTGIAGFTEHKSSIYPNPNSGYFNIEAATKSKVAEITIMNSIGQVVYQENAAAENGILKKQINLGKQIANGVYMLRIKADDNVDGIRFVIER